MLNEFKHETLEEQEPAISYDYSLGRENWNTYEDNLPKDYDFNKLTERARIRKEYLDKKKKKDDKKLKKLKRKKLKTSKKKS